MRGDKQLGSRKLCIDLLDFVFEHNSIWFTRKLRLSSHYSNTKLGMCNSIYSLQITHRWGAFFSTIKLVFLLLENLKIQNTEHCVSWCGYFDACVPVLCKLPDSIIHLFLPSPKLDNYTLYWHLFCMDNKVNNVQPCS